MDPLRSALPDDDLDDDLDDEDEDDLDEDEDDEDDEEEEESWQVAYSRRIPGARRLDFGGACSYTGADLSSAR